MRNTSKEKIEFAQRLADAMEMKGIKQSPTTLQKLFNECFEGKPVKMHTARKWLLGWHVVVIALATTLTSSVGSSLYQYLINNRSFDMLTLTTFAMAIGDFIGTGVCVFALTFAVKKTGNGM